MTAATFKRSIRDLQVWCSSCMVAFAGGDPIAVLIGAKRSSATLIHRLAVHPDHLRQGHGRHLLTSISSKLAILGPPRLVAEVPESIVPARALFEACGFTQGAELTDYRWESNGRTSGRDRLMIPVSVDDLSANGLLGTSYPLTCWERSVETLMARKDEITGLGIVSDERIEAYILYIKDEVLALRSLIDDGEVHLRQLLSQLGVTVFHFSKVHPSEIPQGMLEAIGFTATRRHLLFAATARSH